MGQSRLLQFAVVVVGLTGTAAIASGCRADVNLGSGDDGPTVVESYEIESFDRLDVDNAWEVIVEIGPEPTLEIEVAEDLIDKVNVDQDGDRLSLSMDRSGLFSFGRGTLVARITTPSLRSLDLDGAVEAEIDGLTRDRLDVDLSGASSVDLRQLDLDHLELNLDGAASVEGDGSVASVVIEADGASSVEFDDVAIEEVEVDGSGASSFDLQGADSVSGKLSGASSIDVDEDAVTSVSTSGASSVD